LNGDLLLRLHLNPSVLQTRLVAHQVLLPAELLVFEVLMAEGAPVVAFRQSAAARDVLFDFCDFYSLRTLRALGVVLAAFALHQQMLRQHGHLHHLAALLATHQHRTRAPVVRVHRVAHGQNAALRLVAKYALPGQLFKY
jgi:hypothetical protein